MQCLKDGHWHLNFWFNKRQHCQADTRCSEPMSFSSVKFVVTDTVSRRSCLHQVLQTKKLLISFEVLRERPQQFGCDDAEEGSSVPARAGSFKERSRALVACSTPSCSDLSASVLTSGLCWLKSVDGLITCLEVCLWAESIPVTLSDPAIGEQAEEAASLIARVAVLLCGSTCHPSPEWRGERQVLRSTHRAMQSLACCSHLATQSLTGLRKGNSRCITACRSPW